MNGPEWNNAAFKVERKKENFYNFTHSQHRTSQIHVPSQSEIKNGDMRKKRVPHRKQEIKQEKLEKNWNQIKLG